MNFVFAAGATGGHLGPAIAMAEALIEKRNDIEPIFVGVGNDVERRIVGSAGYELRALPSAALMGKGLLGLARFLFVFPKAVWFAVQLYRELRPKVVIGTGSYSAFAPLIVAWAMRIPTAVHESNVKSGVANRVLSRVVTRAFAVSGAVGLSPSRTVYLPNPVRRKFTSVTPFRVPGVGESIRVLVLGGSQGAVGLNSAVVSLTDLFIKHGVQLVHQTGSIDLKRVERAYELASYAPYQVTAFIDDVAEELQRSHLIISRAGASTVAEICSSGRAAIFVPLPIAGGHQSDNVSELASRGGAIIVNQTDRLDESLRVVVDELLGSPARLSEIASNARSESTVNGQLPADYLADELIKLSQK